MPSTQLLVFILTANIILIVSANPSNIRLPQLYTPLSYQLDLHLPPELFTSNGTEFSGKVKIRFSVVTETKDIVLHSNANSIIFDKITLDNAHISNFTYVQNRLSDILNITLQNPITTRTSHELVFEYTGYINTEDPEARTGLYKSSYVNKEGITKYLLVTQLASTHARTVFPCFDEPKLKATFNVSITLPTDLNVIFNTEELIRRVIDTTPGMMTVTFKTTPRMSTYLLGFIVSDFTCTTGATSNGVYMRVCSRDEFAERRNLALEMTPKLLLRYNNFTNYNYGSAIGKLDIVAIPDYTNIEDTIMVMSRKTEIYSETVVAVPYFHSGLSENWGLIIHGESELLYDNNEVCTQKLAITLGISHELAHQWFGNLITVNWWSEIFINRGLAAFFETYITNQMKPGWDVERQFVVNRLHETLVHDAFNNVEPLYYQDDTRPEHIEGSFSEISYDKGGIIMRMVQHIMGLDNFRNGIQDYIEKHKFGSADINDLWRALDENIVDSISDMPANLSTVMKNWIRYKGYPYLNVSYSRGLVTITQARFAYHHDHLVDDRTKWYVPITITAQETDVRIQKTTPDHWLTPNRRSIRFPFPEHNTWIILNNQQTGYYRVYYDATLREGIRVALESINDFHRIPELTRANLVDDYFNFARANLMKVSDVLDQVKFLKRDKSYFPWKAASKGFGLLLERFGNSSQIGRRIAEDMLKAMKALYESVPISNVRIDDQIYTLKQQLALDWACRLGHQECIKEVLELFRQCKYFDIRPTASLRYIVYCNALRYSGDHSDWKFLWDLYYKTEGPEQEAIRSALGCSRDPTLLNEYLEQSITEGSGFRFVDVMMVFIQTENNPEAIKAAFEFLVEHQGYIKRNYRSTALLEYIFVAIGERLEWPELNDLKDHIEDSRLTGEFKDYGVKAHQAGNEVRLWVHKHHDELWFHYGFHGELNRWILLWSIVFTVVSFTILVCWARWDTVRVRIANWRRRLQGRRRPRRQRRRPAEDIPMQDL